MAPINRILIGVIFFNLLVAVGCHRGYYRRQADAEAQRLILEKAVDPRWDSATGSIAIDPASRMFDPFSADHPPIPPDDATSHQLMHYVDGKEGYPRWNANGDTNYVANPEWQKYLEPNEKGELVLTLDAAFELALLHSTEYQAARETLYLSALDVSLDRFGFDSQLLWGVDSFGTLTEGNTSLDRSGDLNLNKLGITGTNFAVGLANTILFNFGGSDSQAASTLLDFSIIQPLLRGAGRARVMEALTQSERTLLANVRQFARFRRAFYLNIAFGRGINARLSRGGSFLTTSGEANIPIGGYIGLLQQRQNIQNTEFNVDQQAAVVARFQELYNQQQIDASQLTRQESSFYGGVNGLLNSRVSYQNTVDRFKQTLGLPPTLNIVIEDSYLDPLQLVSKQTQERLTKTTRLREQAGEALTELIEAKKIDAVTDSAKELLPILEDAQQQIDLIINNDLKQIDNDFAKLIETTPRRIEYLRNFQKAVPTETSGNGNSVNQGSDIFKPYKLTEAAVDIQAALDGDLNPRTRKYKIAAVKFLKSLDGGNKKRQGYIEKLEKKIKGEGISDEPGIKDKLQVEKNRIAKCINDLKSFINTAKPQPDEAPVDFGAIELTTTIPDVLFNVSTIATEIVLLQAKARGNSIEMTDININSEQATQIASCMRRDWMNARASLVDSWRNIEFVANRLEAQVDLVFDGDIRTRPDASNPFKLRYDTGNLRAGFRFDAPIVRLSERNSYRAALINYQQSKRDFYKFEDSISSGLREINRSLDLNKTSFEVNRLNLAVSLSNVEVNNLKLDAPADPGGRTNTVGLSQDITQGINNLTRAQDNVLRNWLTYEIGRRILDFNMGTMLLDENGRGIDPGPIDSMIGQRAAEALGIELDCQFCDGVAAPGFVAPPLDSRELPSVVDPNPVDEPAVEIENRSSRKEFIAPKLGTSKPMRPETRQPMTASKTVVQSVSQLLAAMKNEKPLSLVEQPVGSDSTSLQTEPQRTNASRTVRSSKTLDPVNLLKTGIVVEPLNQSDADSTEPKKPVSPQRDLSTGKASKPLQKIQTSQLSPITVVPMRTLQPIKTTVDAPNTNVVVRAYPTPVVERDSQTRPIDLKMVAIHNPSPANATVKDSTLSAETHWQNQPSSLGGLLNRFSTEANN